MGEKNRLNLFVILVLVLVIVTETVFFVMQYNSLRQIRQAYFVSEEEKIHLRTELEETKSRLSRQEELFGQILKEKESLNAELNNLRLELSQSEQLLRKAQLEKQVMSDEARKNREVLAVVREKLRLLEGKITSQQEIKASLEVRLQSLRELRSRIRDLRRDAYLKKIEAQKEMDRVKLEKGNRGLVIKAGRSTLTGKRAVELDKIIIKVPPQVQ
jgi:chromosome segregation ATPase